MRNAGRSAGRVARGRYGSNAAQSSVVKLWSVLYAGAIAGDAIVVGASDIVRFDVSTTPAYGSVTVYGEVQVSRALATELKTDKLLIPGGKWGAGEPTDLYPMNAGISHTITLTGARSLEPAGNLSNGATASLSVNKAITTTVGGELTLMAQIPAVTIVKLAATANAGATSLTVDRKVTWKSGDQLHLPSTDFFVSWPPSNIGNVALDHQRGEYVTVTADVNDSTTVPCTALTYRHHGRLMYVVPPANEDQTGTNLSYTYRAILASDNLVPASGTVSGNAYLGQRVLDAAAAGAPTVFDNRCTVGHMTRPIRIEGSTGTDWTTDGYGGTTMVMDLASKQRLQGVAFQRVGKAGQLGQYPIHHHMRSIGAKGAGNSGTFLGAVDTNYNFTRGCVVRDASNRGHTFHGTHAAELSNSIFVNTDTHCIFFEDGSEELNVIDGNLVSKINSIGYGKTPIKLHDIVSYGGEDDRGPAGIWYTNPNNYLRNNIVMGGHIGIWNAFNNQYATCDNERGVRTGNGTIAFTPSSIKNGAALTAPETVTMTATSATNFTRTGSVSGAMSAVTVGVQVTHGPWKYTLTAGGTPFVAGDTFVFDCVNRLGYVGQSREWGGNGLSPNAKQILQHYNNEAGCQGFKAQVTVGSVNDELGTVESFLVNAAGKLGADLVAHSEDQTYFDVVEKFNGWKPFNDWYENQVIKPHYKGWTLCGVGGGQTAHGNDMRAQRAINGIVHVAKFSQCLFAPRTLDNESFLATSAIMTAYGGGARVTDSIMIAAPMSNLLGLPTQAFLGHSGGFSHQSDYYNYGIQMIERNNSNLVFLGAQAGFPGFFDIPHFMLTDSAFNVSTATYNYASQTAQRSKGNAGARVLPPDGSYFGMAGTWVYNHPFHTYGTSGAVTAQGFGDWASLNGVILPANTYYYYHLRVVGVTYSGTSTAVSDDFVYRYFPVNYTHLQTDTITPVTGGTWNVPQGIGNAGGSDVNYPNMRSCAVRKGEAYDVAWSRSDMPNRPQGLIVEMFGFWATDDNVLVSFDWDGATAVTTCYTSGRTFTARSSKADILANRGSNGYWVDTGANKLWINFYGNAGQPRSTDLDTGLTVTAALGKTWATLKVNR